MKLDHISLDQLSVSPANMRAKQKLDLANILPSVRERGVLVPLLVRPNGEPDSFEIVAGRRRFLAAKAVAEERGDTAALPCAIIEAGDDASALEASLIENFARLDPDEVNQWETFARLTKEGRGINDIAATFGVSERSVRRILALGNLHPRIRSLYRQQAIDAATARHLTLASKAQQRNWLALHDSPDGYAPTGHRLKEWLFGGHAIPTSTALFDLARYPAPIIADLFGEDSYFADSEAFWTLQEEAIAAKRAAYLEAGWNEVAVLEPGQYFALWEHEPCPMDQGGRVYMTVSPKGEVEVHEGWLPRKEARRKSDNEDDLPAPRSELTSALRTYVDLHRHAALRTALIGHRHVALRLAVAHMIAGSPLWNIRPEPQRSDRASIAESVANSRAEALFNEQRRAVFDLLGLEDDSSCLVQARIGLVDLFEQLLGLSDEDVMTVLAVVMGETLAAGGEIVDVVGTHIGLDMAQLWQPDEALFELIRDKAVLTAMVAELAGAEAAEANAKETGKVKKAILLDCLTGSNGRSKVENWVPAWLRFPARSYLGQDEVESEEPVSEEE